MAKYHIVNGVEQPGHVHPKAREMGMKAHKKGDGYETCPFETAKQPFSKKAWEEAWHASRKQALAKAREKHSALFMTR